MAAAPPHGEGASGAAAAGPVCCMCGDRGLADELFRCRCCRARLQHRYCSELYPRAAAYRRCNWCLRAPGAGRAGQHAAAVAAANNSNSNPEEEKRKATASASDEERRRRQRQRHEGKCSPRSRSPPAELGHHHPVKKKHRQAEEKTPQPAAAATGRKEVVSTDGASKDEGAAMRAGKTRVNRVRVRRYKLLTEVISC